MKQLIQKQSSVQHISQIRGKDSEVQHDPGDIVEVCAQFYEVLYEEHEGRNDIPIQCPAGAAQVASEEADQALRALKSG